MRCGVVTFFTAEGIAPVDLAIALDERGFGSLFATEHSHVPVATKTPYPMGGPYRRSTTARWIPSYR